MKKLFIILCIIFLFILTGCNDNTTYEDTEFTKLSLNTTQESNENIEKNENIENNVVTQEQPQPVETEINSYSSPVLDKSEGRVNNLTIGCSYINRL